MGEPSLRIPSSERLEDRLDSWKEIAAYLKRDVTTVQRWEKREGMPVRRHLHDRVGSVYASRADLDAWMRGRDRLLGEALSCRWQRLQSHWRLARASGFRGRSTFGETLSLMHDLRRSRTSPG
jgi:hypothetical protein